VEEELVVHVQQAQELQVQIQFFQLSHQPLVEVVELVLLLAVLVAVQVAAEEILTALEVQVIHHQ
jgi:hypothetical protein